MSYDAFVEIIMNISVFWNVTLNSLVNCCQYIEGIYCLSLQGTSEIKPTGSSESWWRST